MERSAAPPFGVAVAEMVSCFAWRSTIKGRRSLSGESSRSRPPPCRYSRPRTTREPEPGAPTVCSVQVQPPSVVRRIDGSSGVPPTAVQVFASTHDTPKRIPVVRLVCRVQVAPPSVVRRMVPLIPTAVPVFASANDTLLRDVPGFICRVQVAPPSVVRRIVALLPTAVPVFASTKDTPKRRFVVPLICGVLVAPPSVVRRIVPPPPTAVPVFASTNDTPKRPFPVP